MQHNEIGVRRAGQRAWTVRKPYETDNIETKIQNGDFFNERN